MAILKTTTCHKHGHPEFHLTYDPKLVPVESDRKWLIQWLEESVADGSRFLPGQTCQFGLMITKVHLAEDGSLSLLEPDMQAMPVVWVECVSHTLAQLRLQKDVVESVLSASHLSFPSLRQSALICSRLRENIDLVMERLNSSGNDSGWFFGCRGEDHDHNRVDELKRVSLYEAAVRYLRQIVPYLAMPENVLIGLIDSVPTIFHNGEPLEFKPGSFLAMRYSKK